MSESPNLLKRNKETIAFSTFRGGFYYSHAVPQACRTPSSQLFKSKLSAFTNLQQSCIFSAAYLPNMRSKSAIFTQHCGKLCAALLPKLCSNAAEVVQDSCLSCAAMLHNLCQTAAQILAVWFSDVKAKRHRCQSKKTPMSKQKDRQSTFYLF